MLLDGVDVELTEPLVLRLVGLHSLAARVCAHERLAVTLQRVQQQLALGRVALRAAHHVGQLLREPVNVLAVEGRLDLLAEAVDLPRAERDALDRALNVLLLAVEGG